MPENAPSFKENASLPTSSLLKTYEFDRKPDLSRSHLDRLSGQMNQGKAKNFAQFRPNHRFFDYPFCKPALPASTAKEARVSSGAPGLDTYGTA